jgi:hypothetical protein
VDSQDLTRDERGYQRWQPRVTGPRLFPKVRPDSIRGEIPAKAEYEFVSITEAQDYIDTYKARRTRWAEGLRDDPITPEDDDKFVAAFRYMEETQAADVKASFSNEMMELLMPIIYRQSALETEQDREYNRKMSEYLARQQQYQEKLDRETADRESMFSLIPTLFPNLDLDLSEFGGEMDPALLPALIQMAQIRASERSQKDAQQVRRPIVRFA